VHATVNTSRNARRRKIEFLRMKSLETDRIV
jgi:hypothetical protein